MLQHHWRKRGEWTPDDWSWPGVVVVDGQVVGVQDINGVQFGVRRTVSTGSWLGQSFHGRGIGTEMRAAVLHLAFAGLGADRAETSAWDDNAASLGVTRKLGYQPNGDTIGEVDGRARRQLNFVLTRSEWERHRRADIEIHGLDGCLSLFGTPTAPAADEP